MVGKSVSSKPVSNSIVSSKPWLTIQLLAANLLAVMCFNKRQVAKIRPLFRSPPKPLLKSDLQPFARYGTYQEIISRRPEQMYSQSDTKLEWPGRDHYLSRTRINAGGKMRPLFKPPPGQLLKSGLCPWSDVAPIRKP